MRRLIANHVGPLSHECVEKDIKDQTRIKGRQSSDSYLIAKQICCDSVLAVTNENILKVDKLRICIVKLLEPRQQAIRPSFRSNRLYIESFNESIIFSSLRPFISNIMLI